MSARRTWIVVLPVAALLIAGCGGGGDEESTESTATTTAAPTALSMAELLEQGDAICGEVNAAVGSASSGEGGDAAQAADLYSGMVASLNNLGAPQEKEGYTEFSGAAEELATAENEVKLAAEREDTAALEAAESSASSALTTFQNAASEYGFKECSEGPSAPSASVPPGSESGEVEPGGAEAEAAEPEAEPVEPEAAPEPAPEVAPETGGAEGGGSGAPEAGSGSGGGSSGGIGPG